MAPHRPAPKSPPRAGWALLGAVLAAALALRVWLAVRTSGLTMDSPLYVRMAEDLGRTAQPLGPAHHGYPAIVALASLAIPGRELPGRIVSLLAGLLLVAVTYRLARRLLPVPGATVAAALVALHPLLAVFSGAIMTESTFQALAYSALLELTAARSSVAAALLGLAYCVRPEALVLAIAALPALAGTRRRVIWLGVFALAVAPEVALLSMERGALTLTPKTALIEASAAAADDAEWRIAAAESLAAAPPRPWLERAADALPAAAGRYPHRLVDHLARIHQAWPTPLMALSVAGAIARPGLLLVPLALILVLPTLGVTANLRFPQTLIPALAVYAAVGAWWLVGRVASAGRKRAVALGLATLVVGGLAWCWWGPAGESVRRFEDAPIPSLRRAGRWLAVHGRPGAAVMDRKPYVPFFAGMRHVLMPDDDYDTIVEYARRSGVDYLVVEEYVMWGMRRQFVPLMTEPDFRAREQRLRMIFGGDEGPMTGVAIFEVAPPRVQ